MEDKKINYTFFHWGPFLYKTILNKEEIQKINDLCDKNNKDYRINLAGLMNQEYEVDRKKIFPIIAPYLQSYLQAYVEHHNKFAPPSIELLSCWVNYMTKYESNPIHTHGGDLSFIIFTSVPEKLKEEYKNKISRSKPGTINFIYKLEDENMCINGHNFLPEPGDFFIFPGKLHHYVNTFSCDGERISVSGNIKFKNNLNGQENI